MKIIRLLFLTLPVIFYSLQGSAQDTWSLARCIKYAGEHNIQLNQQELQARLAALTLKQSQLSQIPSLNGSVNYGYNFGRSVNPTTYKFDNTQFRNGSFNLSSNVTLFNWFERRNIIAANKYNAQASRVLLQKLANDISLNVATAFLQILQAREQLKVSQDQVKLTTQQLGNTIKQVEAGALPESNRTDLIAQLARDSANLITSRNNITLAVLQMKALLNLDFETEFVPEVPENIDEIPLINLLAVTPAQIYEAAVGNQPQLLADSLQELAASKRLRASKSALYPGLSLYAGVGTNYASSYVDPLGRKIPFDRQLNNNLNENIGISLNIPLFNGWQTRSNVRQAAIDLENQRLISEQDKLTLKQNIYQAYADARAALETYHAARKNVEASQTSFFYASKRYELGLINSVDYLTTQNNLYKAQTDLLTSHYEYIFKMKLLEFYKDLTIRF